MKIESTIQLDEEGYLLSCFFPGQQPYYLTYLIAPTPDACQVFLKKIEWAKLGILSDTVGLLLSLRVLGNELEGEHGPCLFIIDPAYLEEEHSDFFIADLAPLVDEVETSEGPRLIIKNDAILKCWHDVFGDEPIIINSEKEPT